LPGMLSAPPSTRLLLVRLYLLMNAGSI